MKIKRDVEELKQRITVLEKEISLYEDIITLFNQRIQYVENVLDRLTDIIIEEEDKNE